MPSNHLILYCPLLLPPSIFPSSRVFSSEAVLRIRWPKYWSVSFSISPSNEHPGLISFRMDCGSPCRGKYLCWFLISRVPSTSPEGLVQQDKGVGKRNATWLSCGFLLPLLTSCRWDRSKKGQVLLIRTILPSVLLFRGYLGNRMKFGLFYKNIAPRPQLLVTSLELF